MKKTVLLSLTAALLLSALASCGENASAGAAETLPDTPKDTAASRETEPVTEPAILPDVPDTLDLGGDTYTIMFREALGDEFYAEKPNGEVVNDAVYERNRAVEERLNCTLTYIANPSQDWNGGYQKAVTNSVAAGDHAYDIISGPSFHIPTLITDGVLYDLSEVPYLDFGKPWWVQKLLETTTFGPHIYLVCGDISLGLVRYMNCTYYNKTLAENYDCPDLNQLVLDGKWTLDRLKTLSAGIYSDVDGNGKVDTDKDIFGYVIPSRQAFRSYYDAADVRYLYIDEKTKSPVFNPNDTQSVALADFFSAWKDSSNDFYIYMENNQDTAYPMFKEDRVLFAAGRFVDAEKGFRDMTSDFGILPVPKWSEEQDGYASTICGSESTFGVPVDSLKTDTVGAVMELLAYESYQTVTPAYFNVAFKFKYTRGESNKESEILDLIRAGATFTPIVNLSKLLGNADYFIIDAVQQKTSVVTLMTKQEKAISRKLESMMETLK